MRGLFVLVLIVVVAVVWAAGMPVSAATPQLRQVGADEMGRVIGGVCAPNSQCYSFCKDGTGCVDAACDGGDLGEWCGQNPQFTPTYKAWSCEASLPGANDWCQTGGSENWCYTKRCQCTSVEEPFVCEEYGAYGSTTGLEVCADWDNK